jgi:hypothetical protein
MSWALVALHPSEHSGNFIYRIIQHYKPFVFSPRSDLSVSYGAQNKY